MCLQRGNSESRLMPRPLPAHTTKQQHTRTHPTQCRKARRRSNACARRCAPAHACTHTCSCSIASVCARCSFPWFYNICSGACQGIIRILSKSRVANACVPATIAFARAGRPAHTAKRGSEARTSAPAGTLCGVYGPDLRGAIRCRTSSDRILATTDFLWASVASGAHGAQHLAITFGAHVWRSDPCQVDVAECPGLWTRHGSFHLFRRQC